MQLVAQQLAAANKALATAKEQLAQAGEERTTARAGMKVAHTQQEEADVALAQANVRSNALHTKVEQECSSPVGSESALQAAKLDTERAHAEQSILGALSKGPAAEAEANEQVNKS